MIRNGSDLIIGCSGGLVVRLDAASGTIEARSGAFGVDQVQSIAPLGACAYAVSGAASGASLRQFSEVLGCRRVQNIIATGPDTTIIGAVGNIAVLDDACCNGRPNVYRPATIFHVDLETGATSPEVDLRPEPEHYPAGSRPLGQGSTVGLAGHALYLGVDHTLYRYDDAIALSTATVAHRIARNLVSPPIFLAGDRVAVRLRDAAGNEAIHIDDVHDAHIREVASYSLDGNELVRYERPFLSNLLTLESLGNARYVSISDGKSLHVTDGGLADAADESGLVMTCKAATMIGNQYLIDIVSYDWPR